MGKYENPMIYGGTGSPQSIYEDSTVKRHEVGARGFLPDGRVFYYARNGAVALEAGKIVMSEVNTSAYVDLAVDTPAVGDTQFEITTGASAMTALGTSADPEFENGLAVVSSGTTGASFSYPIIGHDDIGTTATGTVYLGAPIVEAFNADATVTVNKSPWADVLIAAAAQAHMVCGVPLCDVTASTAAAPVYHWVQTWGLAGVWHDAATAAGAALTSGTTAGQVEITAGTDQIIGVNLVAPTAAADYGPVFLSIAP